MTIEVKISGHKEQLLKEDFQVLLNEFILEYLETQEDLTLRENLKDDSDFVSLNRKLEEKSTIIPA